MAKVSLASLKALVVFKWKPTVDQVKNWMDSFRHKDDAIAISEVTNLQTTLNTLSAGIIGQTPYKRVTADYAVQLNDSVIAVGHEPLLGESPGLIAVFEITLPDPATCANKEFCIKRYRNTTTEILTVFTAAGKLQLPTTGQMADDYNIPDWGGGAAYQRWKSNGTNYEAI
jgi:hypothetical protein